jgi:hypothetical protein
MKSIKEYPRNEENPFIDQISAKTSHKLYRTGDKYELVDKWGEISNDIGVMTIKKEVDRTSFIKIYVENLQEIFSLEKREYQVFGYILTKLKKNSARVYIDRKDCMSELGISRGTLISGLTGLLEKDFIARSDKQNMFFINPALAFNGNRLVLLYSKK